MFYFKLAFYLIESIFPTDIEKKDLLHFMDVSEKEDVPLVGVGREIDFECFDDSGQNKYQNSEEKKEEKIEKNYKKMDKNITYRRFQLGHRHTVRKWGN